MVEKRQTRLRIALGSSLVSPFLSCPIDNHQIRPYLKPREKNFRRAQQQDAAMHDDLTPIDTHYWTYTKCRTQSRSFHHTEIGALSSHRQSSRSFHHTDRVAKAFMYITPTELRPNPQVFAPPRTSDTVVLQMAKRHQKASCSCSNVFENAQPNNQTRLPTTAG